MVCGQAARAALFSAQRLADQRLGEARELRFELDALKFKATNDATDLESCKVRPRLKAEC